MDLPVWLDEVMQSVAAGIAAFVVLAGVALLFKAASAPKPEEDGKE